MMNVKMLLKRGKKALNKFKKYPTKDNLNEVKVFLEQRLAEQLRYRNESHGVLTFQKLITKPL